jgi:tetratricopeptide (TPR) repeat protein
MCAEPAPEERKTGASATPPSEAAQLAARALALIVKVGFTRDDLAPAEDFARRATEKEPDSAAAWGVRAGVQAAWIFRNWDSSEKRRQDTQTFANHALALDPNEPEALLALGHVLRRQGAFEQAEALLRRAIAANPNHVRLARALGFTLSGHGRNAEGRVVLQELVRRVPRDPLVRYELATTYGSYGPGGGTPENFAGVLEQLDAALALQPFSSALVMKAALVGGWRGDLPAMRAVLDQLDRLPLAERSEDRSVAIAMWAGVVEHRPDRVEAAAALTARNYFDDSILLLHPKSWSLALAHRLAGKDNTARADWQAAEAVLRQRIKDDPDNMNYPVELAATLAWLGQREEAARLVGAIEPVWKEGPTPNRSRLLALYYAALGDAARAAPYLPQTIDQSPFTSRQVVPLDPWWDKIRGAPEFAAALQPAGAKK